MTTTDTGNALLAAIIANLDEDTPRLVYADWLQENGDDDRAEFIRVQVALARTEYPDLRDRESALLADRAEFIRVQVALARTEYPDLRDRESALLAANRDRWLRVPCPKCKGDGADVLNRVRKKVTGDRSDYARCQWCDGTGDVDGLSSFTDAHRSPTATVVFARGLADEVQGCRLADVFEQVPQDPRLGLGPRLDQYATPAPLWHPTAWAKRVFAHHPTITRVPLADKRPELNDIDRRSGWTWFVGDASFGESPRHVTNDLWHKTPTSWYATEAAANDALARAVADVIRAASQQPQE